MRLAPPLQEQLCPSVSETEIADRIFNPHIISGYPSRPGFEKSLRDLPHFRSIAVSRFLNLSWVGELTEPHFIRHPSGLTVGEIASLTGAELQDVTTFPHRSPWWMVCQKICATIRQERRHRGRVGCALSLEDGSGTRQRVWCRR